MHFVIALRCASVHFRGEMNATYIIEAPSAVSSRNCLLGEGATARDAWEDAFGPKPWTPYQKRSAREAWVREVPRKELQDLQEASATA